MSAIGSVGVIDRFSFLDDLVIPPATAVANYEVRFAANEKEVAAAQALRYQVFYDEKQGKPNSEMIAAKRDIDQWDESGFHIIVLDKRSPESLSVIGTVRLCFNESLNTGQYFYTEETFDLSALHNFYNRSIELSRACIHSEGRSGIILMLMWKYTMTFLQGNCMDVMFGCASFSGVDVEQHLPILNYLYQHHLAPEDLRPVPKTTDYIDLKAIYRPNAEWSEAQKSIPPLLRGYLKLGAKISDAAIIDPAFNTVYVAIYVETKAMLQSNPNLATNV